VAGSDNVGEPVTPLIPGSLTQFQFGKRDGLTGDVTGEFQLVNGVNTYAPKSTPYVKDQNGLRDGTLLAVSVDQQGNIMGAFSNGAIIAVGRVALATFANTQGLSKVGGSMYMPSGNSGTAIVGSAGDFDLGTVQGNALEGSNVDLSIELTNMIIAQRGFEANSRMITTADSLLNTLNNLGR
jgi:flagellar hook protein FlgE